MKHKSRLINWRTKIMASKSKQFTVGQLVVCNSLPDAAIMRVREVVDTFTVAVQEVHYSKSYVWQRVDTSMLKPANVEQLTHYILNFGITPE